MSLLIIIQDIDLHIPINIEISHNDIWYSSYQLKFFGQIFPLFLL